MGSNCSHWYRELEFIRERITEARDNLIKKGGGYKRLTLIFTMIVQPAQYAHQVILHKPKNKQNPFSLPKYSKHFLIR